MILIFTWPENKKLPASDNHFWSSISLSEYGQPRHSDEESFTLVGLCAMPQALK
jgi:hypothetical protein